jgi:hypothetical protein
VYQVLTILEMSKTERLYELKIANPPYPNFYFLPGLHIILLDLKETNAHHLS